MRLALERGSDGVIAPASATYGLRISGSELSIDTARGPVVLQAPADLSSGELRAGRLVVRGVRPETDMAVVPLADGTEVFEALKSSAAPAELPWPARLPAGAGFDLRAGDLRVLGADGTVLLTLGRPAAVDAAGVFVETSWELRGASPTLVVQHRGPQTAYPVLVDPPIRTVGVSYDWDEDPSAGESYFSPVEEDMPTGTTPPSPPGRFYFWQVGTRGLLPPEGFDPGIAFRPVGGNPPVPYPEGAAAFTQWRAPGTTHIRRATFRDVSYFNDFDGQALRLELRSPTGRTAAYDYASIRAQVNEASRTLTDPQADAGRAAVTDRLRLRQFALDCSAASTSECPRQIAADTRTRSRVGGLDILVEDTDLPTVTLTGSLRDGARLAEGRASVDLTGRVKVTDPGTGIRSVRVTLRRGGSGSRTIANKRIACLPDRPRCPTSVDVKVNARDVGPGGTLVAVDAYDLAGNRTSRVYPGVVSELHPGARAANVGRIVCKLAGTGGDVISFLTGAVSKPAQQAVDLLRTPLDFVCKAQDKAANFVVTQAAKLLKPICGKNFARCKGPIDRACSLASAKICNFLRAAACYATGLNAFCKGTPRGLKPGDVRRANRITRLRRSDVARKGQRGAPPGGSIRKAGRDASRRAQGVRARITSKTIDARQGNDNGVPGTKDVPGWKTGCKGVIQRGHLLGRALGGPGGDPRNFVPMTGPENRRFYEDVERKIQDEGGTWEVTVVPRYKKGSKDPFPVSIDVVAKRSKPGTSGDNPKFGRRPDFSSKFRPAVPGPKERCP